MLTFVTSWSWFQIFNLTQNKITYNPKKLIDDTIAEIDIFEAGGDTDVELTEFNEDAEFDYDDQNTDFFTTGRKGTAFNRRIPKQKFYKNLSVNA